MFTTDVSQNKILLVDDDVEIADLLCGYLTQFNIRCDALHDGSTLESVLSTENYELLILDIMLPGEEGISLCQKVRKSSTIPIFMLTARDELADRVMALEVGADDYIVKPFEPRELVARIRSALRRCALSEKDPSKQPTRNLIELPGWTLNKTSREIISEKGEVVALSNAEFRLLWTFIQRPQQILTRDQLINAARGKSMSVFDRSIDLLVSRLRQKLNDNPKKYRLIRTIRGEGYVFDVRVSG